jgi:hypothetical protein
MLEVCAVFSGKSPHISLVLRAIVGPHALNYSPKCNPAQESDGLSRSCGTAQESRSQSELRSRNTGTLRCNDPTVFGEASTFDYARYSVG